MSKRGRNFYARWTKKNLDQNIRPEDNVSNMLMEAEDKGISQGEIAEEFGGNLVDAMMKAMTYANRT